MVVLVTVGSRCGADGGAAGPGRGAVAASGADSSRAGAEDAGPDAPRHPDAAAPAAAPVPADVPPRALPRGRRPDHPAPPGPEPGAGDAPVDSPKLVGWYEGGPTPGEAGTAIAVGHRDTRTGPAVFAGLAHVQRGRTVEVRRADGRTAVYSVDRVKVFDKAGFPDKEVYGPTGRPELRVITCGGLFSRRTGYTSNVVVFAHLTATE